MPMFDVYVCDSCGKQHSQPAADDRELPVDWVRLDGARRVTNPEFAPAQEALTAAQAEALSSLPPEVQNNPAAVAFLATQVENSLPVPPEEVDQQFSSVFCPDCYGQGRIKFTAWVSL